MSPASSITRLRHYYHRHGMRALFERILVALRRASSLGQMVLYACDLPVTSAPPPLGTLERKKNFNSLCPEELARLVTHWNPNAIKKLMAERFAANAELWILRSSGTVAAYGWTLKERTFEPHFFPLQPRDVHFFDFFVFPEFRGQNLNPSLVWQILVQIGHEGLKRGLIEAAAWNHAQHASLAKTPFKKLGAARKLTLGGRTFVFWSRSGK